MVDGECSEDLTASFVVGAQKKRRDKLEVNGWLGGIVGNVNWYPITDSKQLEDIPKTIGLQLIQNVETVNAKLLASLDFSVRKDFLRRMKHEEEPQQSSDSSSKAPKSSLNGDDDNDGKSNSKSSGSAVGNPPFAKTLPDLSAGNSKTKATKQTVLEQVCDDLIIYM